MENTLFHNERSIYVHLKTGYTCKYVGKLKGKHTYEVINPKASGWEKGSRFEVPKEPQAIYGIIDVQEAIDVVMSAGYHVVEDSLGVFVGIAKTCPFKFNDVQSFTNTDEGLEIKTKNGETHILRWFGDNERPIVWSVEDFEGQAREIELAELEETDPEQYEALRINVDNEIPEGIQKYDRSRFKVALKEMIDNHDSEGGINWDTVLWYLNTHCKKQEVTNA